MTKTAALAGALAAALWGGVAFAQDDCPAGTQRVVITETPASSASADASGNAQITAQAPGVQRVECRTLEGGVGGSGNSATLTQDQADSTGPSESTTTTTTTTTNSAPMTTVPTTEGRTTQNTVVVPTYAPPPPPPSYAEKPKKVENDMRGLTLLAGGGVEAYAGALAPRVRPGAAWGVTAAFKPTKVWGIELGYTGAANDVAGGLVGTGGPDIIRNGGQAALTFGLTSTAIQPYALAGVGIDRYTVRGGQASGFRSDTSGAVPVGGGIRAHIGHFTADARGAYDFTFSQDFASGVGQTPIGGTSLTTNAGRYTATMNLGGTF